MIKFYSWPTPNGQKVAIMLEEISLPYEAIPVNITKGEQFNPEFLKSAQTTRFQPLSMKKDPTASQLPYLNPALF